MHEFLAKNAPLISAIILSLFFIFFIANCVPKNLSYDNTSVQIGRIGIQYATLKYINNDIKKAERVQEIITWAYSEVDDNKFITLSVLDQEIRKRIQWEKLLPSEKFAAEEFLTFIKTYLENLYIDIGLDAEHFTVYVKEVLLWIDESTQAFFEHV